MNQAPGLTAFALPPPKFVSCKEKLYFSIVSATRVGVSPLSRVVYSEPVTVSLGKHPQSQTLSTPKLLFS